MTESERTLRKVITFLSDHVEKVLRLKAEFEKDLGEIQARGEEEIKAKVIDTVIMGESAEE